MTFSPTKYEIDGLHSQGTRVEKEVGHTDVWTYGCIDVQTDRQTAPNEYTKSPAPLARDIKQHFIALEIHRIHTIWII